MSSMHLIHDLGEENLALFIYAV